MSDFKAKMHQNRFRLGLRPTPGAYSAPPDPLAGFRGPTFKGRGYRKGGEGEREGKAGEGKKRREDKGGKEGRGGDPRVYLLIFLRMHEPLFYRCLDQLLLARTLQSQTVSAIRT